LRRRTATPRAPSRREHDDEHRQRGVHSQRCAVGRQRLLLLLLLLLPLLLLPCRLR
jgi:hypothetical protein